MGVGAATESSQFLENAGWREKVSTSGNCDVEESISDTAVVINV